jgi:pyruvate dehydrogenase (quinone)
VHHLFGYPGDGINGVFGALEVKTDPEVPPLPPHITLQQAINFSMALLKGDPDEAGVIKGAARQVLDTILPGKR